MRRDLARLASEEFDLLVVGGGIYGAAAAWDATQRGLSVALIDKGDFGGATSFNNAKTVHGGVRSLQRGRLAEVREYLEERRAFSVMLPHLVHPLPFLLPTYRSGLQHRLAMRAYFALYDLIARDRNAVADPSKHLPPSRLISREECLRLHPALDPAGVTGGVVWYDAQFSNSDRAGLAFVASAVRSGGCAAANYVEATSLLTSNGRVQGVMAADRLGTPTFPIRARTVLLAAGAWTDEWLQRQLPGVAPLVPTWSLAMNLIVRPVTRTHAVAGKARGRLFFLAPWHDVTIAGTSHDPWQRRADDVAPRHDDVVRLMADLDIAFPGLGLTARDVRLVHRGLLPATEATARRVKLLRHSPVTNHAVHGMLGLVSLVGVRYTTARRSAEQAIDMVGAVLGRSLRPCATATTRLDGGAIDNFDEYLAESVRAAPPGIDVARLVRNYGSRHTMILTLMQARPELAAPLGPGCAVTGAEIVYAVTSEMAMCLADAVLRRTDAGSRGHPGAEVLEKAASLMADRLGWTPQRRADEIAAVNRAYETAL